ncbi:MAG: hypothetical protein KGY76_04315 [Candidatus Thermoplasmatota archaeon]|nr:hypothetical protein [Candidatus Thermoplasmatota archaeon]
MLQNSTEIEIEQDEASESDEYMTVFFVFDSVLENSGMQSQTALELFKNIQNESLQ